jgi:hypothetical protein
MMLSRTLEVTSQFHKSSLSSLLVGLEPGLSSAPVFWNMYVNDTLRELEKNSEECFLFADENTLLLTWRSWKSNTVIIQETRILIKATVHQAVRQHGWSRLPRQVSFCLVGMKLKEQKIEGVPFKRYHRILDIEIEAKFNFAEKGTCSWASSPGS